MESAESLTRSAVGAESSHSFPQSFPASLATRVPAAPLGSAGLRGPAPPPGEPGPAATLFVPVGAAPSPCDLLHPQPLGRLDLGAAAQTLTFAFASGDGDVLTKLVDFGAVAPTRFVADDFAVDLGLKRFVERCLPVLADGRRHLASTTYLLRFLCAPPEDRATVAFRQCICWEMASSPALYARVQRLYVRLRGLRDGMARASVGREEGILRRLGILRALREVVECAGEGFSQCASGLSRVGELGERMKSSEGYRRLCELLDYESRRAELDVRIGVGFDGRIRSLQPLACRERRSSRLYASPLGRLLGQLWLLVRGYRASSGELLSRLVDDVFASLEADVLYLFPLIGDLEVYLGAMGLREAARARGHRVCLPEFRDAGPRVVEGLFNPWLLAEGRACLPCDLQLGGAQHLTFITGPNSGGKTRLLQSLSLCQLLGQCGLFVPAARADLRWADGLFASLIEHARVDQVEGRLGTELARIRRLFERCRMGTMVIVDELCSGTNPSEGEAIMQLVLEALDQLEPQALITTHFLQFAARLRQRSPGYGFLEAELGEREEPTYRFREGVARTSLAHRVAARLGVTRESLRELMAQNNPQLRR